MNNNVIEVFKIIVKNKYNGVPPTKPDLDDLSTAYCNAYKISNVADNYHNLGKSSFKEDTWFNPPEGNDVKHLLCKAVISAHANKVTIVGVVRANTETQWWADYCKYADVTFITGRISLEHIKYVDDNEYVISDPAPVAVLVFRPDVYINPPRISTLDIRNLNC